MAPLSSTGEVEGERLRLHLYQESRFMNDFYFFLIFLYNVSEK